MPQALCKTLKNRVRTKVGRPVLDKVKRCACHVRARDTRAMRAQPARIFLSSTPSHFSHRISCAQVMMVCTQDEVGGGRQALGGGLR